MNEKSKKSLTAELELQSSNLGSHGPNDDEYGKVLNSVVKINHMIEEDTKVSTDREFQEKRFALEEKKFEEELALKKKEFKFEKDKFDHQTQNDTIKNQIALEQLHLEQKKLEIQINNDRANRDIQKKESWLKFGIELASLVVFTGIQVAIIAFEHNMGIKALNMEYIDNGMTPKRTLEAAKNVRTFLMRKY